MNDPTAKNDLGATKQLALTFLDHCFKGNMEAAVAMLAPGAIWWVLGDPQKVRVSGTRQLEQITKFLKNIKRGFPEGLQAEILGVTAEGERVAIEASSTARMSNGQSYSNRYHFLIKVRDGRVLEMREYLDTYLAYEAQLSAAPPPK
ncbi:MAG: nuclear transport factor 2 family protein [Steroidobacteraceae bacterium]